MSIDRVQENQTHWINTFSELNAFWKHDGNPKRPHALLTAKPDGRDHSDGFFNWGMVAQYPLYTNGVAQELALMLKQYFEENGMQFRAIDRVVGPGYGAITLADRLAEECSALLGKAVKSGFTEKSASGVMTLRLIQKGEVVLTCEDTITTGDSVYRGIQAINQAGAVTVPLVVCVCNRSGKAHVRNSSILSLITVPMNNWTAEECPLCKLGSEAIKPKTPVENWTRLTAAYN